MLFGRNFKSFENSTAIDPGCVTIKRFPNGWWAVAFSEEVKPGQVLRTRLAGRDLVIYRTLSGAVSAIEPYCPHLGTHLGYGGKVEGENIVCPAHRFAFNLKGDCVKNMYGSLPARTTTTKVLPTVEVNGFIFVWRHAELRDPTWEIPEIGDDSPALGSFTIRLSDHPQEVIENIVDWGHFLPLHGYEVTGMSEGEDAIQYSEFKLMATLDSVKHLPFSRSLRFTLRHTNYGVGCFSFDTIDIAYPLLRARLSLRIALTPEELRTTIWRARAGLHILPESSRVSYRFLGTLLSRALYRPAIALMLRNLKSDGPIWGHKSYLERPGLAKGDGPIGPYRKWVKRFYSIGPSEDLPRSLASV
ncbi:Rieske 2Fe-2S domain-containing protein [Nocardia brasiliensis]|uniref:Rieske 2Fe-2S domain-containing protein n=1 Tax=Nocardia brasiliensis TaxID=37326 RepID=UPI00245754FB|nr:Rieske 2Fe-2S domain-containing protein [Nocardia brasiliensis]